MATVVLLHPFPVDARFWDDVTPALAAMGHEVVAPDQIRHARVGDPHGEYHGGRLRAVVDHFKADT
jgi:pimeloyl-ACP methyl ester carboxylesterase